MFSSNVKRMRFVVMQIQRSCLCTKFYDPQMPSRPAVKKKTSGNGSSRQEFKEGGGGGEVGRGDTVVS